MIWEDEAARMRLRVMPWLVSCLVASVVPLLLLLAHNASPSLAFYLTLGGEPDFSRLPLCRPCSMITCCDGLSGASRTFFWSTVIAYWGIGLVLSICSLSALSRRRRRVAYLLLTLAIAGLFFVAPLLSTVWVLAVKGRYVSALYDGYPGAWRHVCNLRGLLILTFFVPLLSLVFARISSLLEGSAAARVVTTAGVVILVALLWTHFWLID